VTNEVPPLHDAAEDSRDSAAPKSKKDWNFVDIGEKLFEWRDYTPIPLIVLVLFTADPSVRSATLGTLLVVLGELIRVYSVAFIGMVSRTRNTGTAGASLITTGPFAHVRNPLYVGNFCITLGMAAYSGVTWLVLLTIVLFAFQYYCIVKHEERLLIARFGREYEDYMQRVPAWVPTRMPKLETLEWPESFSKALRSERRTLAAIALMLLALALLSGVHHPAGY
jgi:protein-S-isoprenylcysteine O-methyltransferase Ste14